MSLVRTLMGGGEVRAAAHPRDPALVEMFGLGRSTRSGMSVTPMSALQVAAVYSCVDLISSSLAMMPLELSLRLEKGGREPAVRHPLYWVLKRRPNKWQTTFEWLQMMTAHKLLRGTAYSQIITDRRGQIAELVPLHPDRVTPFWAPNGEPAYWHRPASGQAQVLLASEVHVWRALSDDGLTGLSPIRLHREAIGLAMATEEHAARLFSNGAQIGGFIKHPKTLSDTAYDHLRKSWADRYQGVVNAHKPAILEEGMDYVRMGMTSDEAQFLESRKFQRGEIAGIYRVPPHMIGDTEKTSSWGSGVESQGIGFVTYTLGPHMVSAEQAMERDFLLDSDLGSLSIKLNSKALMRGDMKTRKEYLVGMVQAGIMHRNEAREVEDLNPQPGLDEFLTPLNMVAGNPDPKEPSSDA